MSEADIVICGRGLSSLALASLLARRGRKVLLLGREEDDGDLPFYCAEGYTFDTVPPLWLGGDPSRPHPALVELGIELCLRLLDPGLQVVLPRHRLSVYREEERWREELEREFPEEVGQLWLLFQALEGRGRLLLPALENELSGRIRNLRSWWSDRRSLPFYLRDFPRQGKPSLSRRIRSLGSDSSRHLVEALLWGLGGTGGRGADFSAAFAAIVLSALRRPIYAAVGGGNTIYQKLLSVFRQCGGTIHGFCDPLSLLQEGGIVRGLLDGKGKEFRARTLFIGPELYQSCFAPGRREGSMERRRWPVRRFLTLFLGVEEEVLPQEMAENVLLLPEAEGDEQPSPIWIALSTRGDETRAPRGKRAVTAFRMLVDRPGEGWEKEGPGELSSLLRDLEAFLPFLPWGIRYQEARWGRHFCLLDPIRGWGLKMGIAPSTQIGYLGGRRFRVGPELYLLGELPLFGFGLRSAIDTGYYWANLHTPLTGSE